MIVLPWSGVSCGSMEFRKSNLMSYGWPIVVNSYHVPITTLNACRWSYFDSAGSTLVFSVDDVFSYKVVERRGIIPLGPTVRFPFDGSNLEVALLRGFTGLAKAARKGGWHQIRY